MMKKKFLFINYIGPGPDIYNLYPDNGLALLAQVLINSGYGAKILDFCTVSCYKTFFKENKKKIDYLQSQINMNILDFKNRNKIKQELSKILLESEEGVINQIFNEIKSFKPDFIGFKIWVGFGTPGSFRIAKRIKQKFPNIKIIGGGPQAGIFKEDIMKYAPQFDYIIYGEGEESLPQLLSAIKSGHGFEKISSLIYNDGQIKVNLKGDYIDISKIPFPCYDTEVYPAMAEDKIKIFIFEESRGCPNSCYFCIHPRKMGNRYRIRDINIVMQELELTSKKLTSKYFRIAGSNPPQKNILKLAKKIKGKGYTYSLFGHANMKTDFNLLKQSGCGAMFFGIESGSPHILKNMIGKNILLDRLKENIAKSYDSGIYTAGTVIIPTPMDTEETIEETIAFLQGLKVHSVTPGIPYLEPETLWWDNAEKLGFNFSNKKFLRKKLLLYEAFPPFDFLAEQLPYRISNFSYEKMIDTRCRIIELMKLNGITHDIVDYTYLCAKAHGTDVIKFRDITDKILAEKDTEALEDLVKTINKNLEVDYNKTAVL